MSDVQLTSLYQQLILDHFRNPRHRGELPDATVEIQVHNPSCGDEVTLQLRVEEGVISAVAFRGEGCSISQASASMMSDLLAGLRLEEAVELAGRFTAMLHGDPSAGRDPSLKDLRALAGVARFPVRVKCALLGFDALREALGQTRRPPSESGLPPFPPGAPP
jgi:nitrogen fixation protein NifU and related proteins